MEDVTAHRARLLAFALAVAAVATSARNALAMETEARTGPVSGMPLVVGRPSRPLAWIDLGSTFELGPAAMTLSDGGRWHREGWPPRWEVSAGLSSGEVAAAVLVGNGSIGIAAQVSPERVGGGGLGITATAQAVPAGGWDVSLTPAFSFGARPVARVSIVPFAGARARWGSTVYDVRGWSSDRANPYATAITRDLALAPLGGLALSWRSAELRGTVGWEQLLVDEIDWEDRPTSLSRSSGPFAVIQLRVAFEARGLR